MALEFLRRYSVLAQTAYIVIVKQLSKGLEVLCTMENLVTYDEDITLLDN